VEASCRTGPTNFVTTMREGLTSHFGAKPVGLGGVFLIKCGKAKLHVMVCLPIAVCQIVKLK
jgi:hypothetical protein